ncbi:hypothetical protein QWI17_10825 [Gilvimarinus sp. SDUM040013]|uniref:HEPN domain-containing protein n=1 Tax=Gilvimarinus gilvus TaxID=3058038 RepID=A0ABU4RYY7_9GAMM|nr:hypothetical protein [Gilvimarinus sp. SDUM040013]MDO3386332.1 hypothetical protein [Gilvimarinus sp. SDUM040013]MDX6850010.1 hypothetical protein [Gilvimarinus sp. SDUM040013]
MLICTEEKIRAAESFIKSTKIQLSIKPADQSHHEKFIRDDFFQINATCYFLNAVVFELIVKIFWEIDNGRECRHTHLLDKLYPELSDWSRAFLENQYITLKNEVESTLKDAKGKSDLNITYADLESALVTNKEVVMDYKYEMKPNSSNSVFDSIVTSQDFYYTIPYQLCEKFFSKSLERIKILSSNTIKDAS